MLRSPDIELLPFKTLRGVKYFELVAEEIKQEILPGIFIHAWGYNGSTPGPLIVVNPGDYVTIRVHNKLLEPTGIEWHGLDFPVLRNGGTECNCGQLIDPGESYDYQFKIQSAPGTHMYHAHSSFINQTMMGLVGGFIVQKPVDIIDEDYFVMLSEFKLLNMPSGFLAEGVYDIDPGSHYFNFHTMNGKCYPMISPIEVKLGEQIRIRLANGFSNVHPIHLHGHQFLVTASDGNELPKTLMLKKNTLQIAAGECWDIEFNANNKGCWPLHCAIPHHMSNNMIAKEGGLFTFVKYT